MPLVFKILFIFVNMFNKKIAIVGSGNVAWHLSEIFNEKTIEVTEVCSRNQEEAKKIATAIQAKHIKKLKNIGENADLIILAVSDDAIEKVCKKLKCKNKIVAHTSGIANTQLLKACSKNFACFYPLQTFTKYHKVDFSQIPVLISANNIETENTLKDLANLISLKVEVISDIQRQKLHLSAVIVNNFTNHLYTLSSNYLAKNTIDFELLKPLIQETVNKISSNNPKVNQTGPAKRNDVKTIEKHFNLIEDEDLKEIYKILTLSIYTTHNE